MLDERSFLLVQKYDTQGPRYTSYPTAPHWQRKISSAEFKLALPRCPGKGSLAIYTHIPFCEQKCHYCACNVVITRHREQAERYLDYLKKELLLVAPDISEELTVTQMHWGGGTPTYLSSSQMERLFCEYKKYFKFSDLAEISIEIDPRVTTWDQLKTLRQIGFNRVSMGVQDFNPEVQHAIHRDQTEGQTTEVYHWCRKLGFDSINMDFVYGLPFQNHKSFKRTLQTIIALNPDRIAFYNYAHVPWMVPGQKFIPEKALPAPGEKFSFLKTALEIFDLSGYLAVGMDHFAKPQDPLVQALREGTLRRDFMGYTTQKDAILLAFGVSAISDLKTLYVQNFRKLSDYYKALDGGGQPFMRGHQLTEDDMLRRHVITKLLCGLTLAIPETEAAFQIRFFDYFRGEIAQLEEMVSEGLLTLDSGKIEVTENGRLLLRNIAMVFDAYHQKQKTAIRRYSRTI